MHAQLDDAEKETLLLLRRMQEMLRDTAVSYRIRILLVMDDSRVELGVRGGTQLGNFE